MIKCKNVLSILLFLLLISDNTLSNSTNAVDSIFSNFENELLLINIIPIGTTYEKVKNIFPHISNLVLEGRHFNLYDAKVDVDILNHKGKIEFNFQAYDSINILYSYYYFIDSLDKSIADSLYLSLKNFYSNHYGIPTESIEFDPSGFSEITSVWKTKDYDIGLTNNIYKNYNIVGWGFHKP